MTAKHIIDGLHMAMRTTRLPAVLGIERKRLWLIQTGRQAGMTVAMLDHIQQKSDVPIEQLWAWYRLPEGAPIEPYRPK